MTVRPQQFFTQATGQRAYTLVDVMNNMNDQINGSQDPSTADTATLINTTAAPDTGVTQLTDSVSITKTTAYVYTTWDAGWTYITGAWQ